MAVCNVDATVGAAATPIGALNCPSHEPHVPHLLDNTALGAGVGVGNGTVVGDGVGDA